MATPEITATASHSSGEVLADQLYKSIESSDKAQVAEALTHSDVDRNFLESFHGRTYSLLHWAVDQANLDIVEAVVAIHLNTSTSLELRDEIYGETPLHWNTQTARLDIFELLIKAGASLEACPSKACRLDPFMGLAQNASPEGSPMMRAILESLMERNPAAINRKVEAPFELTYLHSAIETDNAKDIKWLLARGADPRILVNGRTAWDFAWTETRFSAVGALALAENMMRFVDCDLSLESSGSFREYTAHYNSFPILLAVAQKELDCFKDDGVSLSPLYRATKRYQNDLVGLQMRILESQIPEPSCMFEIALQDDVSDVSLEEIDPPYLSLVMPFFRIMSLEDIRSTTCDGELVTEEPYYCSSLTGPALSYTQAPTPLDEYCSPFLFDNDYARAAKCSDQVLLRVQEGQGTDGIITVNQLWLWKLEETVISSPSVGTPGFPALWSASTGWPDSAPKQIGKLLSQLIALLEQPFGQLSILDSFEKAIIQVSEKAKEYLDNDGLENIKIEKEKDYLHQINDIREELSMIKRIVAQQEEVWKEYASSAWPDYWTTGRMAVPLASMIPLSGWEKQSWKFIMKPQELFERYRRRIAQLNEDAERVQGVILTQLDLKQKHASLREAHSSAIMSAAVLGFTIITVIFAPLAFVIALFALPIQQFQENQVPSNWGDTEKPNGMYTINYIGKFTAVAEIVSVALTGLLMWVAIKYCIGGPIFLPSPKRKPRRNNIPATSLMQKLSNRYKTFWRGTRVKTIETDNGQTAWEEENVSEKNTGDGKSIGRVSRKRWHGAQIDDIEGGHGRQEKDDSSVPLSKERAEQGSIPATR